MKSLFLPYILVIVFISNLTTTHAGGAIAGATEPTQIMNNVELLGINAADLSTSINTNIDMVENTILDPIANGLIASAQEQAANDILSWVNGGFSGAVGQPLLVADPERYIKNQGLVRTKQALDFIPSDTLYGDTIFNSLVDTYQDKSVESQLTAISSSNIPSLIQEQMCSDASLTELARKDVQGVDGTYNNQDLAARKRELYNYACTSNPTTDKVAAQRLNDLRKQNPDVGGWDTWLAMTAGGDNAKNKLTQAQTIVSTQKGTAEYTADRGVFDGENAISAKDCIEYVNDQTSDDPSKCLKFVTLTPGESVQEALSKAGTASFDRLSNIMGSGALTSFLTTLAVSKLSQGLNSTISSALKGAGKNTPSVTLSNRPVQQDLAGDTDRKSELLRPIQKQLDFYMTTLNSLEATDRSYLTDMNTYEGRIISGRSCYDTLVSRGYASSGDYQVQNAYAFYADRQSRVNSARSSINTELPLIRDAKALVATTTAQINASNSTQQISSIFNAYTLTVEQNNYPATQADAQRRGEYMRAKSNADHDKDMDTYASTCNDLMIAGQNRGSRDGGGSRSGGGDGGIF